MGRRDSSDRQCRCDDSYDILSERLALLGQPVPGRAAVDVGTSFGLRVIGCGARQGEARRASWALKKKWLVHSDHHSRRWRRDAARYW